MSIASELTRLQNAKAAIKQSLENKGATIDSSATLSDYPSIIDNLPSGGDNTVLKSLIDRTITSIDIPSGITIIGNNSFAFCSQLTAVTIPSTVTDITSNAFLACGITSITLPDSILRFGGSVFMLCAYLNSINIPTRVTILSSNLFALCTSLRSITIPSNITKIETLCFSRCGLTSVTIPNSVTSIGNYAFRGCTSLTSITIEATTPPTLGANAFDNTNNCPIYVPCESVQAYKTATNWSTYADRITCEGGADEPKHTVKLIQGGCYANSGESTFTYDLDGTGINYTLTGFEIADDLYYIDVTGANDTYTLKSLVTLDYDGPTIKAGDTVTLILMPYWVQDTDVDTWNVRGIYFGFKIDSGVTTLKVTIDDTNNIYTLKAL